MIAVVVVEEATSSCPCTFTLTLLFLTPRFLPACVPGDKFNQDQCCTQVSQSVCG